MDAINGFFAAIINIIYGMTGNFVLAIVLFTALTKVVMLPITLWAHRNGIKMVEMMPDINRLKIKYYGDNDTIAEETQKLYKEQHYHPFAGMIPMILQLLLLSGVIGAVRKLLEGQDSIYTVIPSEAMGATLLMPVLAGLAALALGVAQNHNNPLQREQTTSAQWSTNGISILISLVLGAFVPIGVGVYWIAGNLLSILQQLLLNAILPAKKYVNYADLDESRKELASIDKLSTNVSKEDRQREKQDYKRFFSVANKHLVFYSESSGFYKYFQSVIEYLLEHSNVIIHYITSDPKDKIFDLAENYPKIHPYYIGEKKLITLMMKMDADIVVMTMPDIENYHIKRSYVRDDIEYIYMFHGLYTGLTTLRAGALDHYDTLLMCSPGGETEIKAYNEKNGIQNQKMVPCGYGVIDEMANKYELMQKKENENRSVLVAPSWQNGNIIESCLHDLSEPLLNAGFKITVRPHPQYIRRFPQKLQKIVAECAKYPKDQFQFQLDFSSNESVYSTDVLVTDWSNIGYEYALATKKPVLFVNTPRKLINEKWTEEDAAKYCVDQEVRNIVGRALEVATVRSNVLNVVEDMINNRGHWEETIDRVRYDRLYHFGESGKYGAKYILNQLIAKQSK